MVGLGLLFASVPDPRASNARHELSEVLVIAFAAMLCGAESCLDMAEFGASKADMLSSMRRLEHGVPSHDTSSRVFRLLNPEKFEAAFRTFMSRFAAALSGQSGQIGTAGQVVALDGKSLRGAVDAAKRSEPLHPVTAWATEQGLGLVLHRAPGRSEVTAAREIMALLDLTSTTVTADALHGNRLTAAAIRARGGDNALAIKGNRGPLHRDAQILLADPNPAEAAVALERAHRRHEERCAWVAAVPADWAERHGFDGLAAMARIDSLRRIGDQQTHQIRYFALSRRVDPTEALRVVRAQWTIENNQHWLLDVALAEDRGSTRNDRTAENLALLRCLTLNLLRADPEQASIRRKIKRAGWKDEYLIKLLSQMR